jgi:hypothetical protein
MTTTTYYIVRVQDKFGDSYPLLAPHCGIDGERHTTLEAARAVADKFASDREFRKEMRLVNCWERNTVAGVYVAEVNAI